LKQNILPIQKKKNEERYYLRALSYNIKVYERWTRSRKKRWVYMGLRPISKH